MDIKGHLDGIQNGHIEGWCFDSTKKLTPVDITIWINGQEFETVSADVFRKGLQVKGIHPTGNCGFKIPIANKNIEDITKIEVFTKERNLSLKNSPLIIRTNRLKMFYMHIPKTAGSSLNHDISHNFPNINKKSHIEGVLNTPEEVSLYSKNFLSGHLSFPNIVDKFSEDKWDFITLLRNPIDQLESHINWLIKVTDDIDSQFHNSHGKLIHTISYELKEMDLSTEKGKKKFIEQTKTNQHYRNLFENCQTKYFIGTYDRNASANDLYNAIKVLDSKFLFVGLSEYYNDFLRLITEHYGFQYQEPQQKKNTNKKKKLFFKNSEFEHLIYDLVKYDNIIYDYVKAKWANKQINNES